MSQLNLRPTRALRTPGSAVPSDNAAKKPTIIYEEVTQAKKQLQVIQTTDRRPPPGYDFVQAGSPLITEKCKEYSRLEGYPFYEFFDDDEDDESGLANRAGYMVEKSIYRRAKLYLGFDRSSRRRVRPASTSRIRPGQQAYLDARALDHLNEKYPRMPKKDKQKVILQGFTVGDDTVGTASNLHFANRVDMAVNAYARHQKTDYDALRKRIANPISKQKNDLRMQARMNIEDEIIKQLKLWRAPEDEGQLESVVREVQIISDDDDDDAGDENPRQDPTPARSQVMLTSNLPRSRASDPAPKGPPTGLLASHPPSKPILVPQRSLDSVDVRSTALEAMPPARGVEQLARGLRYEPDRVMLSIESPPPMPLYGRVDLTAPPSLSLRTTSRAVMCSREAEPSPRKRMRTGYNGLSSREGTQTYADVSFYSERLPTDNRVSEQRPVIYRRRALSPMLPASGVRNGFITTDRVPWDPYGSHQRSPYFHSSSAIAGQNPWGVDNSYGEQSG